MVIDLSDTTYSSKVSPSEVRETKIDLTGTLFSFADGSKVATTTFTDHLKVQVDNDALLEKYSFVFDYGPRMWLAETDNDGWWPGYF